MEAIGATKYKTMNTIDHNSGFTLVELLVAILFSAILMGAIYSSYLTQQRSYVVQEYVTEMQQNIRAALMMLERDIRMAGYDPTRSSSAGFVTNQNFSKGGSLSETVYTNSSWVAFTADLDDDGTIDLAVEDIDSDGNRDISEMEQISYRLNGSNLQRYSTVSGIVEWQTIAENLEQLEFNYILVDGSTTTTPNALQLKSIRAVQVSILGRSGQQDPKFTNNGTTYTTASGAVWGPYNDNFRRRFLVTTIKCRNMGL